MQDNSRILDDVRCVVGGTDSFGAEFSLGKLFTDPVVKSHPAVASRHTVDLRKWLLSGLWKDVIAIGS